MRGIGEAVRMLVAFVAVVLILVLSALLIAGYLYHQGLLTWDGIVVIALVSVLAIGINIVRRTSP